MNYKTKIPRFDEQRTTNPSVLYISVTMIRLNSFIAAVLLSSCVLLSLFPVNGEDPLETATCSFGLDRDAATGSTKEEFGIVYSAEDEEKDSEDDHYYDDAKLSWEELSPERREYFTNTGWTREKWDGGDNYYQQYWEELNDEQRKAVIVLGWTEENWVDGHDPDAYRKSWLNLTPEERSAAEVLGYTEHTWHTKAAMLDFAPIVFPLSIPELEHMNLDYLETLDVKIAVVNGTIVNGDDELIDEYQTTMSKYIKELRAGSKLYLKYEDQDPLKAHVSSLIGAKVIVHMKEALRNSPLREMGYYLDVYDTWPLFEDNYSFFVGGTNTSTPMHYDYDAFNFLWLVQGRKRVVLIPNDERTIGKYECVSSFEYHSCWTGVDILSGPLPEYAIEIELGPGDGLFIPGKTWHAVMNLEPSVAYGLRIDPEGYVFDK